MTEMGIGHYDINSVNRNAVLASFRFRTDAGGAAPDPAYTVDEDGILHSIIRVSDGIFACVLAHRWRKVMAIATIASTTAYELACADVQEGPSLDNAVVVMTKDDGGVDDFTADIHVQLFLLR